MTDGPLLSVTGPAGGPQPTLHLLGSTVEPLLRSAAAHPDRLALVHEDTRLTYAQLCARVARLAAALAAGGVRAGDRVAFLLPGGADLVAVYYALQHLGAAVVPLNLRSIPREVAELVRTCGAGALVLAPGCGDVVRAAGLDGVRLLSLGPCDVPGATDLLAVEAGDPPPLVRDGSAVARVQHTGGSTGRPKGVERTHAADLVEVEGILDSNGLPADDEKVVLIGCPLDHHGGHSWFTMALAAGATVVVAGAFDPGAILEAIERYRVSYLLLLPPTTYTRLMTHPDIERRDLTSVRVVQSSAGGTSLAFIRDVHRWFPNARLNYGWGQSESGLGTTLVLTQEMAECDLPRAASIGRPMRFLEVAVVDERGAEVPDGTVGEAVVRSLATMRGYCGRPELTAAALTPDGWLRTGDMMERDADGYLYLRSRKRDLVKSGGENVFVAEVEAVVREHPAVLDCLVYGVPDACLGEAVAVAVELRPGATLTLEELQAHCRCRLASFKKPRSMEVLDALGRDGNGKVNAARVVARCEQAAAVRASLGRVPDVETAVRRVDGVPGLWRIGVPNVRGFEPVTWCYLLRGERSLLVDTGADGPEGYGVLLRALERCGVAPGALDVLVTHEHADHAGLARVVGREGTVLLGAAGLAHLRRVADGTVQREVHERALAEGFAPQEAGRYATAARRSSPPELLELETRGVADGEVIAVGGQEWCVVATPGHTPGHVCLHHPASGTLLTGDHVLAHVTPPVTFTGTGTAMADHLAALRRVAALAPPRGLPGHGPDVAVAERALALAAHHEQRALAALALVAEGGAVDGATLAAALPSSAPGPWHERPDGLRWLTAGHAIAYLDLLVQRGHLRRETREHSHRYVAEGGDRPRRTA
jgi:acyl-CoA synthetase (AMP-forming)/AMP-acid ligase II